MKRKRWVVDEINGMVIQGALMMTTTMMIIYIELLTMEAVGIIKYPEMAVCIIE